VKNIWDPGVVSLYSDIWITLIILFNPWIPNQVWDDIKKAKEKNHREVLRLRCGFCDRK
jgi:hypothetical protein